MKKLVVSALFALSFVSGFTQNWEELNNSVNELVNKGQYEKAVPVAERAIEAAKKEYGDQHLNYVASIYNLGTINYYLGRVSIAEAQFIQAKGIFNKSIGENNLDYCLVVHNLGVLYERTSQYEKAEPLLAESTRIRKKLLGEEDPVYAQSLNSLATLYANIGQYKKGELLYTQAIEIQRKTIGENHPEYITSLNNLAFLYKSDGEYEKAESLYLKAAEMRKKLLGEDHPDYGQILNNLGTLYTNMNQFEKAERMLTQAKEIRRKALGESHPYFATSLNNLALLYERIGQNEKAELVYLQAKDIRKKIIGEAHPDYAQILNNLGIFYIRTGELGKAEPLVLAATDIKLQNLKKVFGILSEREKRNYLNNNIQQAEINNSLLYKENKTSFALPAANLSLQLFLKSLALSETRSMLEFVNQSKDSSVRSLLNKWQNNKRLLARQYSLPPNRQIARIDSVEADTETIEKELTRRSSEFDNRHKALQVSIADVRNKLGADEVAIEFVQFLLYGQIRSDSIIYAAYILNKNDSLPVFVSLCEKKQLQKLLDSAGKTTTSIVNSFYRGFEIRSSTSALGRQLYQLIWAPLEPYLKGVKKISYSPAGELYGIAFHVLPVDSSTLLMDKYQLQQYTSTRQVALREVSDRINLPTGVALFGDADFSMDSLQLTKQKRKENISTTTYSAQNRGSEKNTWSNLPGTAKEVKKIKQVFDRNKISVQVFTGAAASEENLKALSGNSPQIIHIATHGFFLPETEKKRKENALNNETTYKLVNDPLLRSGLVLSGGNYTWSGKTPIDGVEDGIATAYEISQLNLSNTELVVLSACETALGDIKGSEGVFGLQRAFKMAGVKKMIVSLWQVPDKETAELMTAFYGYWMKGKTINDAFTQAQTDMRKKYIPFYWAAFVLVE